jgi:uncharacterized protein YjiS (DUF1127 family)
MTQPGTDAADLENDEQQQPEMDMNVVEQQLKSLKDETLEEIAKRVNVHMQQRRDGRLNLGSMTDHELRSYTRRKYGF